MNTARSIGTPIIPRLITLAAFLLLTRRCPAAPLELYVATNGNDAGAGSADRPFAGLERARDAIRELKQKRQIPPGGVTVLIRPGLYFLPRTLILEPEDSGTASSPIAWTAPGGDVTLSGGRVISGWRHEHDNLWTVQLSQVKDGGWFFRQLFADNQRLPRACIPKYGFLFTEGPLSQYADVAKQGRLHAIAPLRQTHPDAFCGFRFTPGDFQPWPDVANAEVITFHSWEASWQTIRRIDLEKREVNFNSPCRYPIGIFSPRCQYRIENLREGLTEPGEWQLDRNSGLLSYLARDGEDPGTRQFIAPFLEKLLVLRGDYKANRYVEHVSFSGLRFSHTSYPMGIYDVAPDWPAPALRVDPTWPKRFPLGFTDRQAAPQCGQTIELSSARGCAIDHCELAHIGAYGVGIFTGCSDNRVVGCYIHDAGGGGILLRHPASIAGLSKSDAPHDNVLENNTIRHVSLVHPSAAGIVMGEAHHNRVAHNEISDVGYAGIHLGWTWGRAPNYTSDNLIEANHVHDVMRDLVDAAGIYSLGIETGTVYRGNYVHAIRRVSGVAGGPVAGIYFDEGSRDIHVERNVVQSVPILLHFNQCRKEEQTWSDNHIQSVKEAAANTPVTNEEIQRIITNAGPEVEYRWK